MHWSEQLAAELIRRQPDKQEYVCAAGISPSGSIHIGNFRDVATSYFVVKALQKMGKRARLLFSWDEYDRMRKVPANVAALPNGAEYEKYIGCPYVDVPNPFGGEAANYAAYFEDEFQQAMREFHIDLDYRYQGEMNRSGKYTELVLIALQKRAQIFDILDSFRTQDAAEGERESYCPVSVFCPECGRDTTKVSNISADCREADYTCACGHSGHIDFTKDFHYKLAWKIDWPMRWLYDGVDFEPGGKDHASPGGSYDVSSRISREIFGYEPPLFQGYEFIGIKGLTGKMSGSSGLNLTPATLLKLYQPEVILWLYSKTDPTKAFDFCFDDGILRQYFEFDKQYAAYLDGTADEHTADIMYNCVLPGRELTLTPMGHLVQLGSVVDFNVPMLEAVLAKIGTPYKYDQFSDRLARAKFWLEQCAPENVNRLRATRNFTVFAELSAEEQEQVARLHAFLSAGGYDLDGLNAALYAIPRQTAAGEVTDKELKARQGRFFKNVYRLLLDKEQGPRLYLFLFAIEKERYLHLLDFSQPQTEAERAADAAAEAAAAAPAESKPQREYGPADPFTPFKPEISIDQFSQLDLRVCRIVKAQELRKSHSCLKLTVDDGSGTERVIVSSIKAEYTTDELVGKSIIVVANLAPARFAGTTSQGMLLAATNAACGCQVIFVNEIVPAGTPVK